MLFDYILVRQMRFLKMSNVEVVNVVGSMIERDMTMCIFCEEIWHVQSVDGSEDTRIDEDGAGSAGHEAGVCNRGHSIRGLQQYEEGRTQ